MGGGYSLLLLSDYGSMRFFNVIGYKQISSFQVLMEQSSWNLKMSFLIMKLGIR